MSRIAMALGLALALPAAAADEPAVERRSELVQLVRQDCGFCHGLYLTGGLGPSLKPGPLAAKDDDYLSYVILHGRRGTAMPGWRGHISEPEARWIVEQLKKGLVK